MFKRNILKNVSGTSNTSYHHKLIKNIKLNTRQNLKKNHIFITCVSDLRWLYRRRSCYFGDVTTNVGMN